MQCLAVSTRDLRMSKENINTLELSALRVKIQLFRVAFADMSVKATEALIYAQELGLNDEAYSDMFGSGTPCSGSFIGRTDIIEHMLEEARNGRQAEN